MKTPSALIFSLFLTLSSEVFAHGEEKPGPHGGFIRMPGAFHTEVVKEKNGYRIYLLDIDWENPSVLDSTLSASIENGKKKFDLTCAKESASYFCKSNLPQKGNFKVRAKREGQIGGDSVYKLPLKFEILQNEMPEHKGH